MPYRMQVSAKLLRWPQSCACCGATPDTKLRAAASRTTGTRVVRTRTMWWDVPYCSQCLAHVGAYEGASRWIVAGAIVGVVVWLLLLTQPVPGLFAFAVGAGIAAASALPYNNALEAAKERMKAKCAGPDSALKYLEWYGTVHTFVFASREYLDAFVAANARKVMSDIEPT